MYRIIGLGRVFMVEGIVFVLIAVSICAVIFYKIYDSSRKQQAVVKQTIKEVKAIISGLEKDQKDLQLEKNKQEHDLEGGIDSLLEKASRELRDKNTSHLIRIAMDLEPILFTSLSELAEKCLEPLILKGLSQLPDPELEKAQKFSLIKVITSSELHDGVIEQFEEINSLCREHSLRGIHIPDPVLK